MKNDIRCAACHLMQITGRAAVTSNNSHFVGSRGNCYCKHPEADAAFKLICPDSGRMPGFIAFTKRGTNEPDIKTAPRWCPRKLAEEPKEVSKAEAYRIIDTRRPRGMFFLKEGNGYTGIDNRTGDAWTEEFPTKAECLKWLTDEGGEDDEQRAAVFPPAGDGVGDERPEGVGRYRAGVLRGHHAGASGPDP